MPDLLADVRSLEEAVEQLLEQAGVRGAPEARLRTSIVQAILDLADTQNLSAADLLTPEGKQFVAETIAEAFAEYAADLAESVSEAVQEIAERVDSFYEKRGISTEGLRLATARSEVAQVLADAFDAGMRQISNEIAEATVQATTDAVLTGQIDRDLLTARISELSGASLGHARTQSQASIGAYNQAHRNTIAKSAGLVHFLYFGTLQDNSRAFCRVHLDKVFHQDQIALMKNGMLEPVRVYKGGWRCRHSWLGVDPAWSAELKAKLVPYDTPPSIVNLNRSGSRTMTVILPIGQIPRLTRQQQLAFNGYVRFEDVPGSDTAFRAAHGDWVSARLDARSGSKRRTEFDREWEAGRLIAQAEHEALFNPNELTKRGGPSDMIIDGQVADHKLVQEPITASGYRDRYRSRRFKRDDGTTDYQADVFVFEHLQEPDSELLQEATRTLLGWVSRQPERRAFVIKRYTESVEIEEING